MSKVVSRILGIVLLLGAVVFLAISAAHPEMSFQWNNTITYILYGIYLVGTIILLIAPFPEKKQYISKDL